MGKVLFGACVYVAVHALSYTSGVIGDSTLHSSIVRAEESAKVIVSVLSDVKLRIRPRHCADLLEAGQRVSGVYTIFTPLNGDDIMKKDVYCDMDTDGGGWTVIQKRGQYGNNVSYFYRNWTEYATGFGDPAKEYWIGNNALHVLTADPQNMTLKIVLTNRTGGSVSIDYAKMSVGSEDDRFMLLLGSYLGPPGWDALTYSNSFEFSTYDRDNDEDFNRNCAETFRGAWWYRACHQANLNGLNFNGEHTSYADGINWNPHNYPESYLYSYSSVYMMIRPAGSNSSLSRTST